MAKLFEGLQYRVKTSSSGIMLRLAKLFVGLIIGLTMALIGERILNYGDLSFFLVIITAAFAFYRVTRNWKWAGIFIFSLICILFGLLVRMYILVAPGA